MNRSLFLEVVLVLILVALGIVLYLRPAAEGFVGAHWWYWVVLALLLFAVAGLQTWRRRQQRRQELHRWIREGPST